MRAPRRSRPRRNPFFAEGGALLSCRSKTRFVEKGSLRQVQFLLYGAAYRKTEFPDVQDFGRARDPERGECPCCGPNRADPANRGGQAADGQEARLRNDRRGF